VVATPLWDERGIPIGIVAASVNLLRLEEGMRRAELPANSSVLVVDRAGRIVARRTDPDVWVGRSALDSSAVRDALVLGEGVSEGDFVDGVRRLSGFAQAQKVPWAVIVGIPTGEAYGALRRELLRSLARLALAAGVAAVVAWLLSRRLTRPIRRLAAAAHAYAGGDLAYRAPAGGPEEVAALGATLNRMAAALQRQLVELRAAHRREREAGERALAELRRLHSEFIATAAHELRTPVAAAKSYAELLLRDEVALAPEVRRQALVRLDGVCERIARLVRSLLGASRIQAGRLTVQCEPVDLVALALRVTDQIAAASPDHDVQLHAARSLPYASTPAVALGDAERIEDVLVNLLVNATTYAPAGTAVQVHVVAGEEAVEVQVADRGPGVPEAERTAIFERFKRGRSAGGGKGGLGLGLYLARAYVEAMGGQTGVRGAPGEGATFWFRLPAAKGRGPEAGGLLLPARANGRLHGTPPTGAERVVGRRPPVDGQDGGGGDG
jgi:two-component system OmpR family sensor kinase